MRKIVGPSPFFSRPLELSGLTPAAFRSHPRCHGVAALSQHLHQGQGVAGRLRRHVVVEEDDLREIAGIPDEEYDIIVLQVDSSADIKSVQEDIEKFLYDLADNYENKKLYCIFNAYFQHIL